MRRALSAFAGLLVLALTAGCADNSFGSASVSSQAGEPAARLDFIGGISIPEGSAAAAHVDFIAHSNKTLAGSDIQSADGSVLRVLHAPGDASKYVFLGVRAGTTDVLLLVNGQQVRRVPAIVTAPPASSVPPTLDAGVGPTGAVDASDSSAAPPDAGAPDADAALAAD